MKPWPKVRLGEVIRHRKEFITIDDLTTYKRPRVQLHAQGIVLRDALPGAMIKTKSQQVCRSGEFLVAEIDAKVGGFGIVPDELDRCIVSSHYFLFVIDETKILRRFLDYFTRTPTFQEQVEAQGSTNYAAIRPQHVLGYEIPLPPLQEQRRIVARIEELSSLIDEARALRERIVEESNAFVLSVHSYLSNARTRKIGDILKLDEEAVPILAAESYPQIGVRSFGGGLFKKAAVLGAETTYKSFNRLYEGALVLSQVKGWEGAIAACPLEMAGWFVSPEYRTFRCIPSESRLGYLSSLVRTEWFWGKLTSATRGVGARRERTRPEQFLNIELPMPTIEKQQFGEKVFSRLTEMECSHVQAANQMKAMLPAILDREFKGEF